MCVRVGVRACVCVTARVPLSLSLSQCNATQCNAAIGTGFSLVAAVLEQAIEFSTRQLVLVLRRNLSASLVSRLMEDDNFYFLHNRPLSSATAQAQQASKQCVGGWRLAFGVWRLLASSIYNFSHNSNV